MYKDGYIWSAEKMSVKQKQKISINMYNLLTIPSVVDSNRHWDQGRQMDGEIEQNCVVIK